MDHQGKALQSGKVEGLKKDVVAADSNWHGRNKNWVKKRMVEWLKNMTVFVLSGSRFSLSQQQNEHCVSGWVDEKIDFDENGWIAKD